ncbi:MAG TPA: hypothetical protein VHC67_06935 [Gaiellaceae bacterium]|nr:hypothetical protein [Gaiellaceae bacterium]
MADLPDALTLERHRDLHGVHGPWPRRLILGLIAVLAVLALLNVFGQRPVTNAVTAPAASLKLYAPTKLRGGDLFSARFHITAHTDLKNAELVLDPGWAEGMAINTIEPSPLGEGSSDGRLTLQLGHIPKGESYLLFMQFQVNPTNLAWHRSAGVTLTDGSTPILRIDRRYTIYP